MTTLPGALTRVADEKGACFVFVIDEWDFPMRESADASLQKAYLDYLRDLFKGATYVEAAYMTGILPVRKYGRHSALNLFREYTMVAPKSLAPFMGFSTVEVMDLYERFGAGFSELQRWYDGYLVGPQREHVYNPNSVASAIAEGECLGYWTETETYEALATYIHRLLNIRKEEPDTNGDERRQRVLPDDIQESDRKNHYGRAGLRKVRPNPPADR